MRVCSLLLVTFALTACQPSPSYTVFTRRNQAYYANIADACEKVLAQDTNMSPHIRRLKPKDPSLPPLLQDLQPTCLVAGTNGLLLLIGDGPSSYKIGWIPQTLDISLWQLKVETEGSSRLLFSRRKN